MRILYILHADFETPGTIEDWAKKNKAKTSTVKPFAGEKLPLPDAFDILFVMGGPQSPTKMDEYPYLRQEVSLIKSSIDHGKTVLGFCLGAQLIGEALGGKTEKSPHKEVGVYPIKLTKEGKEDPIFTSIPHEFPVMHWHNDMPGLPTGAKILAASEGCPRQAIKFGEKVYGFQCHPEPKAENISLMVENCPEDLMLSRYTQPVDYLLDQDFSEMNTLMHKMLDNVIKKK
jgi:GMP synthase (glutamine-hydrolysing)